MREERWGALAEEKREVLVSMQEVLRSCHTLLNTTQIPMNGVVNLLQHILRRAACAAACAALPPRPPFVGSAAPAAEQACRGDRLWRPAP